MDFYNKNINNSTFRNGKNVNDNFYAGILVKNRDDLPKYGKGFLKHIVLVLPIIGLLILEPHLSSSVVIIGICSIMMIMAGCNLHILRQQEQQQEYQYLQH